MQRTALFDFPNLFRIARCISTNLRHVAYGTISDVVVATAALLAHSSGRVVDLGIFLHLDHREGV